MRSQRTCAMQLYRSLIYKDMSKATNQLKEFRTYRRTSTPFNYWHYEFAKDRETGEYIALNTHQFPTLQSLMQHLGGIVPEFIDECRYESVKLGVHVHFRRTYNRVIVKLTDIY